MTGFAGETEEEFNQTLEFVNKIQFSDAHVFQYSPRRGTPAAKRPNQISPEIKEARSKLIIAATDRSHNEFLNRHIGKTMEVLFESKVKDGLYEGKTVNYINVHVPSEKDISGEFHKTLLEKSENGIILGKIVD